jgi:DNA-binding LytR/AlgR family response regulator
MLRAVIVEDEPASRDRLRRLLGHHATTVSVVGEADSGPAAVEQIKDHRPDLVFLDISLPGFDGFDVLHEVVTNLKVIITTAHREHALRAFHARAVHYLLKPIGPEDLAEALSRIQQLDSSSAGEPAREPLTRLLCRDGNLTHVVRVADVLFFKADQGYTAVQTENREYLTEESLSALERRVGDSFTRVHRNAIVNVAHVTRLKHSEGDLTMVLVNGMELPVSRRHAQALRDKLATSSR